jgi:Tfp pilus assembly protein PilN
MNQQNVNFLPEDYVEKRSAQRSAILVVGLFVLELVGIVGGYWYLRQRPMNDVRTESTNLDQEQERKSKQLADYKEMTAQERAMQTKVELMAQLMERVNRSVLLRKLHAAVGDPSRFTQIDLKTKEIMTFGKSKVDEAKGQMEAARLPSTETTIDVTGLSPSHEQVAGFLDRLAKIELFEGVQPVFSEEFKLEDKVYRRFKVTMKISPSADTRFTTVEPEKKEEPKKTAANN